MHGSFSVETTPLVGHSLCGSLKIEPKFNSLALTGDPLTYDESNRKFTVYSTQSDLIGETKTYSLHVSFSTYPLDQYSSVSTTSASGQISFSNPCLKPFKFESKQQTSPGSDKFSGQEIIFTLTEFELTPERCEVTYRCTNVVFQGEGDSSIECSDLTFDGVFDG